MSKVRVVSTEPGFITIDTGSGPPRRISVATLLTQPDIPVGLTHSQVAGVSLLANLVVIIIRTLVDKEILDETFADSLGMDWNLDTLIYAIEQLGGAYHEPNFDDVEDA